MMTNTMDFQFCTKDTWPSDALGRPYDPTRRDDSDHAAAAYDPCLTAAIGRVDRATPDTMDDGDSAGTCSEGDDDTENLWDPDTDDYGSSLCDREDDDLFDDDLYDPFDDSDDMVDARATVGCPVTYLASVHWTLAWAVLGRLRPADAIALARASRRVPRAIAFIIDSMPAEGVAAAWPMSSFESHPLPPDGRVSNDAARIASAWLRLVVLGALRWPDRPLVARFDPAVRCTTDTSPWLDKYVPAVVSASAIGCRFTIAECLAQVTREDVDHDTCLPASALAHAAVAHGSTTLLAIAHAVASCTRRHQRLFGTYDDPTERRQSVAAVEMFHVTLCASCKTRSAYAFPAHGTHVHDRDCTDVLKKATETVIDAVPNLSRKGDNTALAILADACRLLADVALGTYIGQARVCGRDCAVAILARIVGAAADCPAMWRCVIPSLSRMAGRTVNRYDGSASTTLVDLLPRVAAVRPRGTPSAKSTTSQASDLLGSLVQHEPMIVTTILMAYLDDRDVVALAQCDRRLLGVVAARASRRSMQSGVPSPPCDVAIGFVSAVEANREPLFDSVSAAFAVVAMHYGSRMAYIEALVCHAEYVMAVYKQVEGGVAVVASLAYDAIDALWKQGLGLGRVLTSTLIKAAFVGSSSAVAYIAWAAQRLNAVCKDCRRRYRGTPAQYNYSANSFAASNASRGIPERSARGAPLYLRLLVWMEAAAFSVESSTPETSRWILDHHLKPWLSSATVAYAAGRLRSPGLLTIASTWPPETYQTVPSVIDLGGDIQKTLRTYPFQTARDSLPVRAACVFAAAMGAHDGHGIDGLVPGDDDTIGFVRQLATLSRLPAVISAWDRAGAAHTPIDIVVALFLMADTSAPDIEQLRMAATAIAREDALL